MSPDELSEHIKEVWREIVQAEHARGSATAGAQAAYEEALRRFRHMQLEVFTVTLGELAILREQIAELTARIEALEAGKAREIP